VSQFLSDITSAQTSDSVKLLALLCVGDIGSSHDLSGLVDLKALIDGAAGWPSEDVRAAGAQAIGMNAASTPCGRGWLRGRPIALLLILQGSNKEEKRRCVILVMAQPG
jgi:hypothetical protein